MHDSMSRVFARHACQESPRCRHTRHAVYRPGVARHLPPTMPMPPTCVLRAGCDRRCLLAGRPPHAAGDPRLVYRLWLPATSPALCAAAPGPGRCLQCVAAGWRAPSALASRQGHVWRAAVCRAGPCHRPIETSRHWSREGAMRVWGRRRGDGAGRQFHAIAIMKRLKSCWCSVGNK